METPTPNTNNHHDALKVLTSMGFDLSQAQSAIDVANGDVEYAINYLLNHGVEGSANAGDESDRNNTNSQSVTLRPPIHKSTTIEQIEGRTSQYSYENGRSACSFIALATASTLLQKSDEITTKGIKTVTESFLDESIQNGCQAYAGWKQMKHNDPSVEHTSVEEILQCGQYYTNLALLPGGIRQGILSNEQPLGPSSLHTLLLDCQSLTEWICVVMIKPPETILLVLPPSGTTKTSSLNTTMNTDQRYYLFDSHPRNIEFGTNHAYCRIHMSLSDLVQSVSNIFPITDLGPDVPEYMSSMYNSFDLYALHLVTKDV
jgi:hypothetical protein